MNCLLSIDDDIILHFIFAKKTYEIHQLNETFFICGPISTCNKHISTK